MKLMKSVCLILIMLVIVTGGIATAASSYRSFIEWNGPYFNVRNGLNTDSAFTDYLVNTPLPLFGSPFSSPVQAEIYGSATTPYIFVLDHDQRRVQVFQSGAGWRVEDLNFSDIPVQGYFGGQEIKFTLGEVIPGSERIRLNGYFLTRVSSLTGYGSTDSVYAIVYAGAPNIGGVASLPLGWNLTGADSIRVEYAFSNPPGTPGVGDIDYVLYQSTPTAIPLQLNEATSATDPAMNDLTTLALNGSVRVGMVADMYLVNGLPGGTGSLASYELSAVGAGGAFNFVDSYPGDVSRPYDVEIVETGVNTAGLVAENAAVLVDNANLTESITNLNTYLAHDYRITYTFDTSTTMNQSDAPDNMESDITYDPITGRLHTAFCNDGGDGTMYAYSDDYGHTWSTPIRISPVTLVSSHDRPVIVVRRTGEIHVVYEALVGVERHLYHTYSADGSVWAANVQLTTSITPATVAENRYCNLLVDLTDNVHLIWAGDDDLYHRIYIGSSWGAVTLVASGAGTGYSAPDADMDNVGRIYVAYVSDASVPSTISYIMYNGAVWGSYESGGFGPGVDEVTTAAGVASEASRGETFPFPQIALSGDTIWIFWVGTGTEAWPVATNIRYNRVMSLDGNFTSGAGTAISAAAETASPGRFTASVDTTGKIHIVYPFSTVADRDGLRYKVFNPATQTWSPVAASVGRTIFIQGAAATQYAYEPRLNTPYIAGQVVPMLSCAKAWTALDAGVPRIAFKIIDGVVTILDQTSLSEINQFAVWQHGIANTTAIPGLSFTISNTTDAISNTDNVDATEFNVGPTDNYFDLDGTVGEKNDRLFLTDSDGHMVKVIRAYDNIDNCFAGDVRWDVPGKSDGTPLQTYKLGTVGGTGTYVVWASPDSTSWTIVNDLLISGPTDRHCEVNRFTGEVRFGDGTHGLIPPDGTFIRVRYEESVDEAEFGSQGSNAGQLNLPRGIAARWNASHGEFDVYICDTGNNRLQKFAYTPASSVDPEDWTSVVTAWNRASSATDVLNSPEDIEVVVHNGRVYLVVSDNDNQRLVVYHDTEATGPGGTTAPAFVTSIGEAGMELNGFQDPRAVSVAAEDSGLVIFAADADRNRVMKFFNRDWLTSATADTDSSGGSISNVLRLDVVDVLDNDAYLLLQPGAVRTVELRISRTDSLTAIKTVFTFPNGMIDVQSVNEGNLWSGESFTNKIFLFDYDNALGRLEINASMVGDNDGLSTNGTRVIASVVLRADSFSVPQNGSFAFSDALCEFRDANNVRATQFTLNDMSLRGGYLADIGSPSGDPGLPPSMIPWVDGRIDFSDVNVFTQGWNGNGITFDPIADIGPYTGTTVPALVAAPDGRLDAYDLLSLNTMYNWFNTAGTLSRPEPREIRGELDEARSPVVAAIRRTENGWAVELQARAVERLTTAHLYLELDTPAAQILSARDGGMFGSGTTLFLNANQGTAVDICMGRLNRESPFVEGSGVLAEIEIAAPFDITPRFDVVYELRDNENRVFASAELNQISVEEIPLQFGLDAPYPNPFNATATFTLRLDQAGPASLKLFNVLGQEAALVLDENLPAGVHRIRWNAGSDLTTGVYFARFESAGQAEVRKIILLK